MALTPEQIAAIRTDLKNIVTLATRIRSCLAYIELEEWPFEEFNTPVLQSDKDVKEALMRTSFGQMTVLANRNRT